MKTATVTAILLFILATAALTAQEINLGNLLRDGTATQSDTLTARYSAFAHTNWTQAGVGINIKNIVVMFNSTVLPQVRNFKSNLDASILNANSDYEVKQRYTVIMAGYILRLGKNFYPFGGTGTALMTDMIEVRDTSVSEDTFTIKGKEVTYGTGVIGAFYTMRRNTFITGSVQFRPLLPFIGAGISF